MATNQLAALMVPTYISKQLITEDFSVRLIAAAHENDISTVFKLLRKTVNPNIRDEYGSTALVKACEGMFYTLQIVRSLRLPESPVTM